MKRVWCLQRSPLPGCPLQMEWRRWQLFHPEYKYKYTNTSTNSKVMLQVYHQLIHPGPLPLGYRADCIYNASKTHKIPLDLVIIDIESCELPTKFVSFINRQVQTRTTHPSLLESPPLLGQVQVVRRPLSTFSQSSACKPREWSTGCKRRQARSPTTTWSSTSLACPAFSST